MVSRISGWRSPNAGPGMFRRVRARGRFDEPVRFERRRLGTEKQASLAGDHLALELQSQTVKAGEAAAPPARLAPIVSVAVLLLVVFIAVPWAIAATDRTDLYYPPSSVALLGAPRDRPQDRHHDEGQALLERDKACCLSARLSRLALNG